MTRRHSKIGCFVLEGSNSFASVFYFYYLFFFMERQFAFGNLGNLSVAALNGLVYMLFAWVGGRFGQRFGYFKSLRTGFSILALSLAGGAFLNSVLGQLVALVFWTSGLCFIWPTLEAMASEGEDPVGLQRMIGIYNLVWAGSSALSYFSGGYIIERLGPRCIFWIPLTIHVMQLALVGWLQRQPPAPERPRASLRTDRPAQLNPRPIARARSFLKMAWWANPFAYVAINTVAAVVPGLARRLQLSPEWAGFCCSVWLFARFATFGVLWLWTGWQYRFRWFLGAYLLLASSFGTILLVPRLGPMIIAQISFGMAIGLLYYSSLYYSMDVGEAKGDHGGVHESAIGAGICAGPALGAATLYFLPKYPNSGTWAVGMALCGGLVGLLVMGARWRAQKSPPRP